MHDRKDKQSLIEHGYKLKEKKTGQTKSSDADAMPHKCNPIGHIMYMENSKIETGREARKVVTQAQWLRSLVSIQGRRVDGSSTTLFHIATRLEAFAKWALET